MLSHFPRRPMIGLIAAMALALTGTALGPSENAGALVDTTTGIHRGVVFYHCAQEFGWTNTSPACAAATQNPVSSVESKIATGWSTYNAPVLNFINPALASRVGVA